MLRLASVYDVGKAINPKMVEAQIEGGAGMGLGSALYEELVFEEGRPRNPNLMDYRIPTTMEMPTGENFIPMIVEVPHHDGPFGAKGLAEGTMIPTAPAIANAISDAVGIRIYDLPITRERVVQAIDAKRDP